MKRSEDHARPGARLSLKWMEVGASAVDCVEAITGHVGTAAHGCPRSKAPLFFWLGPQRCRASLDWTAGAAVPTWFVALLHKRGGGRAYITKA